MTTTTNSNTRNIGIRPRKVESVSLIYDSSTKKGSTVDIPIHINGVSLPTIRLLGGGPHPPFVIRSNAKPTTKMYSFNFAKKDEASTLKLKIEKAIYDDIYLHRETLFPQLPDVTREDIDHMGYGMVSQRGEFASLMSCLIVCSDTVCQPGRKYPALNIVDMNEPTKSIDISDIGNYAWQRMRIQVSGVQIKYMEEMGSYRITIRCKLAELALVPSSTFATMVAGGADIKTDASKFDPDSMMNIADTITPSKDGTHNYVDLSTSLHDKRGKLVLRFTGGGSAPRFAYEINEKGIPIIKINISSKLEAQVLRDMYTKTEKHMINNVGTFYPGRSPDIVASFGDKIIKPSKEVLDEKTGEVRIYDPIVSGKIRPDAKIVTSAQAEMNPSANAVIIETTDGELLSLDDLNETRCRRVHLLEVKFQCIYMQRKSWGFSRVIQKLVIDVDDDIGPTTIMGSDSDSDVEVKEGLQEDVTETEVKEAEVKECLQESIQADVKETEVKETEVKADVKETEVKEGLQAEVKEGLQVEVKVSGLSKMPCKTKKKKKRDTVSDDRVQKKRKA